MQKLYYGFYFAGLAAVNTVMWLYGCNEPKPPDVHAGKWTGHRMDVAKRSVIASRGYNRFSVAVVFLSISRDDFERLKEKESQISSAGVSGFYAINFQVTN